MASKLHPTYWRDLAPEFLAARQLREVEAGLSEACAEEGKDTSSLSNCLKVVREALTKLHPSTRDPEAVDEFEARANGTYEEPTGGPARRPVDTKRELERERELSQLRDRDKKRDDELEQLRSQIAELQKGSAR
jgi:hypothetical protein